MYTQGKYPNTSRIARTGQGWFDRQRSAQSAVSNSEAQRQTLAVDWTMLEARIPPCHREYRCSDCVCAYTGHVLTIRWGVSFGRKGQESPQSKSAQGPENSGNTATDWQTGNPVRGSLVIPTSCGLLPPWGGPQRHQVITAKVAYSHTPGSNHRWRGLN